MISINLKKIAVFGAIVSSALILSACNLYKTQPKAEETKSQTQTTPQGEEAKESVTVTITDQGFEPQTVTVKSGGTITWTNNSSKNVQVGSAVHPTHEVNRELTGGKFVVDLNPGQSETVTVTKAGNWKYHNHLSPSQTGTVIVSE